MSLCKVCKSVLPWNGTHMAKDFSVFRIFLPQDLSGILCPACTSEFRAYWKTVYPWAWKILRKL